MRFRHDESWFVRFYRKLTFLYPAAFREEYEAELVEVVRDRRSEARGIGGALRLAFDILRDLFTTAPREHWHMFKQDLRHALRVMRNTPSVTITAILVLAIGIGSTTTVFSIVNAALLRPLPFANPEQLVFIEEASKAQGVERMGPSLPNAIDYRDQARQFAAVASYVSGGFTISGAGEAERIDGAWVNSGLFPMLGVQPFIGRQFTAQEDQPKAETAVLLSYAFWQRRFGGDRTVIGRSLTVNGKPRSVVGVMPKGFAFPENAEIWGPLSLDPKLDSRTDHYLTVIGRLGPGVAPSQGSADLASVLRGIQSKFPDTADLSVQATPLREGIAGEYRPALLRLLGAVGLVLAIACTNIMNLLLARATARSREVAIRTALGASRPRVMRQLLTESLVLGAIGAVAGLALAAGLNRLVTHSSPIDFPYWLRLDLDARVLAFVIAVTVGSVLLFGIAPAVRSSWIAPAGALNELRRGVSAGLRAGRLRQGLVAAQVALSVVLLVGAGVMVRSFLNLQNSDLGYQGRDVLTFRVALPMTRYPDDARREQFYSKMRDLMLGIPGVRGVATATGIPLEGGWWRAVQPLGQASTRPGDLLSAYHTIVSPGYFAALGIPLKNGRDFTKFDGKQDPVVIVSEKLAAMKWSGHDPIGQRVRIDPFLQGEPWRTVVGVVGDIRAEGPRRPAPPAIYVPEAYEARPTVTVVMKSGEIAASSLAGEARRVVKSLDTELPVYSVRSQKEIVSRAMWRSRFYTTLFTAFGAIAMLLAAVGLSGIMAHVVIERTHEIGVRMALGATARDVVRMIVSRAFVLAGAGALAGLVAALLATRSLGALLFEVRPGDPVTMMFVLAVLLVAAMAATWIPARRAARIDPAGALRWE